MENPRRWPGRIGGARRLGEARTFFHWNGQRFARHASHLRTRVKIRANEPTPSPNSSSNGKGEEGGRPKHVSRTKKQNLVQFGEKSPHQVDAGVVLEAVLEIRQFAG